MLKHHKVTMIAYGENFRVLHDETDIDWSVRLRYGRSNPRLMVEAKLFTGELFTGELIDDPMPQMMRRRTA